MSKLLGIVADPIELERLAAQRISVTGEQLCNLRLDGCFGIWIPAPEISLDLDPYSPPVEL
jgi:hypothetical protein